MLALTQMKLAWVIILGVSVCADAVAADDGAEFFEKNVRPLLAQQCQGCHSSPTSPMGGLRVDSREGILKGGARGPAIVPGKPTESLLLRAVRQTEALHMPFWQAEGRGNCGARALDRDGRAV